jgi:hypothetical protein
MNYKIFLAIGILGLAVYFLKGWKYSRPEHDNVFIMEEKDSVISNVVQTGPDGKHLDIRALSGEVEDGKD